MQRAPIVTAASFPLCRIVLLPACLLGIGSVSLQLPILPGKAKIRPWIIILYPHFVGAIFVIGNPIYDLLSHGKWSHWIGSTPPHIMTIIIISMISRAARRRPWKLANLWVTCGSRTSFLSSPIFCLPRLIGFNLDSKQPLLSKVVVMKDSIFFYITHVGEAAWKKGKISL